MNLSLKTNSITKKPQTVNEVLQNLLRDGWDQTIWFYEGSKFCLNCTPQLIRDVVKLLRCQKKLPRYHRALCAAVHVSHSDEDVLRYWNDGIRDLRVLFHASPVGTERQRALLLGVAGNSNLVKAMRDALEEEKEIVIRSIEPAWLAVLYAEGSTAAVKIAERFNKLLDVKRQNALRAYTHANKVAINQARIKKT